MKPTTWLAVVAKFLRGRREREAVQNLDAAIERAQRARLEAERHVRESLIYETVPPETEAEDYKEPHR